jgi:hypothetical protein
MGNSELMQLESTSHKTLVRDVEVVCVCACACVPYLDTVSYTQGTGPASTLVRGALVRDGCALPCFITCRIFIM